MHIQEENWYKPQPGEPYRPLVALPKQLQKLNTFFERCSDLFFTGFDPPKTLVPAAALSPATTTDQPEAPTSAPKPSPTLDTGAKQTATGNKILAHHYAGVVEPPVVEQPQKPNDQPLDPKQGTSVPDIEHKNSVLSENNPVKPEADPGEAYSDTHEGNNPVKPKVDPGETYSDTHEENKADHVPGEQKSQSPSFSPVPGVAIEVPNRKDPALPKTPTLESSANSAAESSAENPDQDNFNDPKQANNAAETLGILGKENPVVIDSTFETADHRDENPTQVGPSFEAIEGHGKADLSELNPSFKGVGNPGREGSSTIDDLIKEHPSIFDPSVEDLESEDISKIDSLLGGMRDHGSETLSEDGPLLVASENKGSSKLDPFLEGLSDSEKQSLSGYDPSGEDLKDIDPSNLDRLLETIGDPENETLSKLDAYLDSNIANVMEEDRARENELSWPDGLPQPKDTLSQLDPLEVSPKQVLRSESALSLSAQQVQYGPSSINGHLITITPTTISFNTPNVLVNSSNTTPSGTNSTSIAAISTTGSETAGAYSPPPAQTSSPGNGKSRNASVQVQPLILKAWALMLAMSILVCVK